MEKDRQPASREPIVDSIVITKELLLTIQSSLPAVVTRHAPVTRLDATLEFEHLNASRPNLRLGSLVLLLAGVTLWLGFF